MKKYVMFAILAYSTLPEAFLSVAQAAGCPVDDCAICGTTREQLNLPLEYYVKQGNNSGSCHIWKESGFTWGCVVGTSCKRQDSYQWSISCGNRVKSATECENTYKNAYSRVGCSTKVSCDPDAASTGTFNCTVTSSVCMASFRQGTWYLSSSLYCPPNTSKVSPPYVRTWSSVLPDSDPEGSAVGPEAFCAWNPQGAGSTTGTGGAPNAGAAH
jgi:hypothetical protein